MWWRRLDVGSFWAGVATSVCAYMQPISGLLVCVVIFIGIDFATGCWASYRRATRDGKHWYFSSYAAWRTIEKLCLSLLGVSLAFVLVRHVIWFIPQSDLLPNIFTAFVCGVELWSWLENAADISEAKVFRYIKKYTINKVHDLDKDVSQAIEEVEKTSK